MNKEKILKNLQTENLGRNLLYYEELNSTQKIAKQFAQQKAEDGTVILTDYQTAGIGTHDRKWYSNKGQNISFTFLLYPNYNIKKLDNLTIEIAEEIVKTIYELYQIKLEIKRPNDLMINNKKVGGILTETKVSGEVVENLFVGIGINVHQINFNKEICNIATSLEKEYSEIEFERETIISDILNKLEKLYINKIISKN